MLDIRLLPASGEHIHICGGIGRSRGLQLPTANDLCVGVDVSRCQLQRVFNGELSRCLVLARSCAC